MNYWKNKIKLVCPINKRLRDSLKGLIIPKFIQQLKNKQKVTIQGDGSCVRAFLHSYDTATAFQCILERGKIGEIYNIGCDEDMEYSIMEVARILIKAIHNTENYDQWISYIEDRPFNDQRYYISCLLYTSPSPRD